MRRKYQSLVSFFVAGSMVLSVLVSPGGTVRAAEPGSHIQRMAETEISAQNDTGMGIDAQSDSEPGSDVQIDAETGYRYTLYEESAGEETARQKAEIAGYTGSETALSIPKKVGQYDVGSIGAGAFKENADITSVVISEGVYRIGYEAFFGCEKLASVTVPSTVTDWDDDFSNGYNSKAFEDCRALTRVTLSEGLTVLGQRAFYGCTSLESVTVPSTIKEFHNQVFYGCTALQRVELKEGMKHMGYQAFGGCTALEEVAIPSTIEGWGQLRASGIMATLHDSAPFIDCTSLAKVTFAEGLKTLEGFQGVRNCPLVTELDIPASVEDVEYAFTDCSYLQKVTMGEGIQGIGTSAFQNCSALREVNIPNSVATLGANAFNGCTSLECLVLPPSAVTLEGSVTSGCTNLKELYLLADAVKWYQALGVSSEGKLYCIEGSRTYELYQTNMSESARERLAAVPSAGAEAEGCEMVYDESSHPAVTVTGTRAGDEVLYRVNDGSYEPDLPQITEPGTYSVAVMVKRRVQGEPMQYSGLNVQTVIQKRQYSMQLPDVEVTEGDGYAMNPQGYEGSEEPVYTYYRDKRCSKVCDGKPETAGVYYVRARVEETDHDLAVESNVAKITILAKEAPGENSGTNSSSPSPEISSSPDPGSQPGISPSPNPGTDTSTKPSPTPGGSSGSIPGSSASPTPGNSSGSTPGISASTQPGTRPTDKPDASGKKVKVKKAALKKVTSPKRKTLKVTWQRLSGATGYQVCVALDKKLKKGKKQKRVKGASKTKWTLKKLKSKKRYYVRVRAYKTVSGKTYYGSWSRIKRIKVK